MLFAEEHGSGIGARQSVTSRQGELKAQDEEGDTNAANCACENSLGKICDLPSHVRALLRDNIAVFSTHKSAETKSTKDQKDYSNQKT